MKHQTIRFQNLDTIGTLIEQALTNFKHIVYVKNKAVNVFIDMFLYGDRWVYSSPNFTIIKLKTLINI